MLVAVFLLYRRQRADLVDDLLGKAERREVPLDLTAVVTEPPQVLTAIISSADTALAVMNNNLNSISSTPTGFLAALANPDSTRNAPSPTTNPSSVYLWVMKPHYRQQAIEDTDNYMTQQPLPSSVVVGLLFIRPLNTLLHILLRGPVSPNAQDYRLVGKESAKPLLCLG